MASSGAPDSKVSTGLDAVVSGELGQQGLVSRLREVLLSAEEQTFSIQSKERRLAEQATSLDNLRKESSGLREERDQLQHQLAELQSFAEKQQEHICKLQKSVQDAKKVRVGYEASLRGLEQRVRDLEEQIETRDVAQSKLQSELEHARLEGLAAAEKVRETEAILAQHKQTSERRTNELRKRCVSLQTAVGANEVELQSVRSEVASLRVGKQNALEEVSVLRDTEVAQKEALRHARGEASQSAERAAMLEKKITELEVQLKAQHVLVDEAHAEQTALEATLDKTRAKAAQDEELAAAKAQHLQNKLDALELERDEQVRTLEKGLHKARSELEKTNKARGEELAQEREAHAASVRGLTTRLNGLQRSLEQHQRLLQEARAERDETVEALSRAKAAQEELCGVVEKQNGEMAAIKAREEALTQALDEASKAAKAALAKANAKAQALEQDLQSAKRSAERADEELAAKSAESVDLSQELESLRKRAQDAADRLNASLQEERDMLTKVRKELGELQEERAREVQAFRERERKAASALQRAQQSAEASLQTEARKREVVETELRKNHKPRLAPLALAVDATSASPLSFVDARDDNVENVGVEADVVDDAEEDGEDGEEEDDEDDEEGEGEEEEEDKIESDEIKSHTAIRSVADILRRKHQRNDGSPRRRMEEEGHRRAGEADPLTSRVEDDQNKRKVRTNQQKMKRMQERSTYPSGSGGGPGNNQTVDLSPTEVKQYLDEILRDDNVSC
ncbi:Hypothetical Protein FCC1311_095662 [Hondaea fermentalgiana]|uniref:Uncharacterized protein n=1 Tax=Hondaea fermentalgiana TaxID=2315210 RepID=A0A2R5GXC5_9STRA|nr:Hypothetical Protein FCC1311_095662 [Hondaea fermentalgiana]|eukprot:GBG33343.1 Hypothetical Protein FCC1311_095662 [Hondaea fermentalgiana]